MTIKYFSSLSLPNVDASRLFSVYRPRKIIKMKNKYDELPMLISKTKTLLTYSVASVFFMLAQSANFNAYATPLFCEPDAASCSNSSALTLNDPDDSSIWEFNNGFNGVATNTSTGVIEGAVTGVLVGGGNTISFINDGTINSKIDNGPFDSAIRNDGTITELTNNGTIRADGFGVFSNGGTTINSFHNTETGVILKNNSTSEKSTILNLGRINQIVNDGYIEGNTATFQQQSGGSFGNFVNNGTIKSNSSVSEWFNAAIFNNGSAGDNGTLTNNGDIISNKYGILTYKNIDRLINNKNIIATQSVIVANDGATISNIENNGLMSSTAFSNSDTISLNSPSKDFTIHNSYQGKIQAQQVTAIAISDAKANVSILNEGAISGGQNAITAKANSDNPSSLTIHNQKDLQSVETTIEVGGFNKAYIENSADGNISSSGTETAAFDATSFNDDKARSLVFKNYGSINGSLNLGDYSFYMLGGSSLKNASVTSTDKKSLFSLGSTNEDDRSIYFNADSISTIKVGHIAVERGSSFVIYNKNNISTLSTDDDAFRNSGAVLINDTMSIKSNFLNNGELYLEYASKIFNTFTINGNYSANDGLLFINTALGDDNSLTDKLVITGDTSGNTSVMVRNRGGLGALTTGNGIEIISVGGKSADDAFTLKSDYKFKGQNAVVGGAYAYSLYHNAIDANDGNWYLRSLTTEVTPPQPTNPTPPNNPTTPTTPTTPITPITPAKPVYQPGAVLYEVYPQALLQMNQLGTIQQRVGNRIWLGQNGVNNAGLVDGRGFWMKVEGSTGHINSDKSTTKSNYDIDMIKTQLGLDFDALENSNGVLVGGAYFQYGHSKTDPSSHIGKGDIKTDGYGVGGTLTWYGNNDIYVDGVGQVMWYRSTLNSSTLSKREANDNDGIGYAVSIEAGKKFALNNGWNVTPQTQLSYNAVDFDSFRDAYEAKVSQKDSDALTGRIGVALDREKAWKSEAGDERRLKVYGVANLYYEFLDGTEVSVTGVKFENRPDRFWSGLGAGLSHNWMNDKYSIYGEANARSSFNDFGDSYSLNGTVGFRMKF